MILVIGLGNPGKQYENTRHNLGFDIIDKLVKDINPNAIWKEKFSGLVYEDHIAGAGKVAFLKPQTFMNLSGVSVAEAAKFFKLTPDQIWVVYDDMDIDFGKTRVRFGGRPAGHNGIKSIDKCLTTNEYPHVRVGIGDADIAVDAFVTGKFKDHEMDELGYIINQVASHLESALAKGEIKDQTF